MITIIIIIIIIINKNITIAKICKAKQSDRSISHFSSVPIPTHIHFVIISITIILTQNIAKLFAKKICGYIHAPKKDKKFALLAD